MTEESYYAKQSDEPIELALKREKLSCNENLLHQIIYRKLSETNRSHRESSLIDNSIYDLQLNSNNFRSKEFTGEDELMFLGCSNTFGFELELQYTWPKIVADELGKSFVNLASGGDSAFGQVSKAFLYFREYGNPKIIFASFPMTRLEVPLIKDVWEHKNYDPNGIARLWINRDDFRKISKSPYNPVEIIPTEFALFLSHYAVLMLDQYCKSNNIIFVWNAWDSLYINNSVLNQINKNFDNYCLSYDPVYCNIHNDMKSYDTFDYARDNLHWGIHKNIHLAEDMLKTYALVAQRQRHAT